MILEFNDTHAILKEILDGGKALKQERVTEREKPNKDSRKIPVVLVPYP